MLLGEGSDLTARARVTQAELVQAATIAKAEGVTVTITAPNGKTYTIAPALDVKGESEQAHDRSMGYGRCVNRKARVLPLAERSRDTHNAGSRPKPERTPISAESLPNRASVWGSSAPE